MAIDVSFVPVHGDLIDEHQFRRLLRDNLNMLLGRDTFNITVATGGNDKIDFVRGSAKVGTLLPGDYSGVGIMNEIARAMLEADPTQSFAGTFPGNTPTLGNAALFSLPFATGPNAGQSIGPGIGFTADSAAATSHQANDALPAPITERMSLLLVAGVELLSSDPDILHNYAADGSSFRLLGQIAALANGQKVRITGLAGDTTGTEEKLGHIEVERVAAETGRLSIGLYEESLSPGTQIVNSPPTLQIDEDNNVWINKAIAGSASKLNVGGAVRAAGYKRAGADVGVWDLTDYTHMYFDGDVYVTGATAQLQGGNASNPAFDLLSKTLVPDLNAGKHAGFSWPSAIAQVSAVVSVPPDGVLTDLVSYTAPRAGNYLCLAFAHSPVVSGTANQYIGLDVPGAGLLSGDLVNFANASADETLTIAAIGLHTAVAGEVLKAKARNYGVHIASVSVVMVCRWLSNGITVRPAGLASTFALGVPTITVT